MGFQMFRPIDPLWGPIPRNDSAPISATNEPIFSNLSVVFRFSDDADSIYETL